MASIYPSSGLQLACAPSDSICRTLHRLAEPTYTEGKQSCGTSSYCMHCCRAAGAEAAAGLLHHTFLQSLQVPFLSTTGHWLCLLQAACGCLPCASSTLIVVWKGKAAVSDPRWLCTAAAANVMTSLTYRVAGTSRKNLAVEGQVLQWAHGASKAQPF